MTDENREGSPADRYNLYIWAAPRELEAEAARSLIDSWLGSGGDPAESPFEPSSDVGWFYRELNHDIPALDAITDARPRTSKAPVWLAGALSEEDEPPARIVAIRFGPDTSRDDVQTIFGLAVKYDLVVFDPRNARVVHPLEAMSDDASATFWPYGALLSVVAGAIGLLLAIVGWVLGIPIVGWLLVLVGGFLVVLSVVTLVAEGRKAIGRRQAP